MLKSRCLKFPLRNIQVGIIDTECIFIGLDLITDRRARSKPVRQRNAVLNDLPKPEFVEEIASRTPYSQGPRQKTARVVHGRRDSQRAQVSMVVKEGEKGSKAVAGNLAWQVHKANTKPES